MKKESSPYTPMMMQYLAIKERYPDTLIFFRLGDFYELFFEDASTASKELGLVLTGKNAGSESRVPMCGVPHHASKNYIARLVERGYRVGIVEQLEDASLAKGLVSRDVTQIFTPGAFIDRDDGQHQFMLVIERGTYRYVYAYADIVTGDVFIDQSLLDDASLTTMIRTITPKEIVVAPDLVEMLHTLNATRGIALTIESNLVESSLIRDEEEARAHARLLAAIQATQKRPLTFLKSPIRLHQGQRMELDADTIQHLELVVSLKNQTKFGSLYWLLDETKTVMGSRLLKQWIMQPLTDAHQIKARYDVLDAFLSHRLVMEGLSQTLGELYDIPRILTRMHYQNANARDLLSLKQSLSKVPIVRDYLLQLETSLTHSFLATMYDESAKVSLLERALSPDAPVSIKEGMMFNKGYDSQLDEWIDLAQGGRSQLAALETQERERTGIKNLKVGYNRVFGYYLEISQGQLQHIRPEFQYERKQTLTNGERFITPELKALELKLLHAQDQRIKREEILFKQLLDELLPHISRWHQLADVMSQIDALLSLAYVSGMYRYIRPTLNQNQTLKLIGSRHPVIEKVMKKAAFVANDVSLDEAHHTILITGPNMGGKSTYMRQIALMSVLAQIGCFVPAETADMMVFDHIFTRMGASDDLVGGQSTFMMEMTQTQYALAHATASSLLIFDEIGRGTSTYDGMALAQAIIEYVETRIGCKTLFSTHYHELTELQSTLPLITNVHASVVEEAGTISFRYKMLPGAMQRSYGVHVATLAGLPPLITERAHTLLASFETQPNTVNTNVVRVENKPSRIDQAVRDLDPLTLSPLAALQWLIELKKKVD